MFFWRALSPPLPPKGTFGDGVWGYPKRKNDIIFEIPTIEHPGIDISHVFYGKGIITPPPPGGPQGGRVRGTQKEN